MTNHLLQGSWAEDDLRRAFVNGAKWWEFHSTGGTMLASDRDIAEKEAETRYPEGKIPNHERSSDLPLPR